MFKLYKDAVKIANDNIILATPLILFMWLLSLYLGISKMSGNSLPIFLLSCTTVIFMTAAFFGGWFNMVKKAIKLSKEIFVLDTDKARATLDLMKKIPSGIGKYFWSFLGLIALVLVMMSIIMPLIMKLGLIIVGPLGLDPSSMKDIFASPDGVKVFIESLSGEQVIKLFKMEMIFVAFSAIFSYLFMLWIPEIVYATKNPFKAIFKSIKKVFKKPWKLFKLFIFTWSLNLVLSFANTFSLINPIIYFIMMILYFYFIVYLVVLLFLYYEREFTE